MMDGNMASCSQKEESQWETRMSVLFEAKQYPEFRANVREYYPSFWLPVSLSVILLQLGLKFPVMINNVTLYNDFNVRIVRELATHEKTGKLASSVSASKQGLGKA